MRERRSALDTATDERMGEARPGLELRERRLEALLELATWRYSPMQARSPFDKVSGLVPPSEPGRCSVDEHSVIMSVAPGRFIMETTDAGLPAALRLAVAGDVGTLTDLTHSRTCIRVSGERATWILLKGLSVDLDVNVLRANDVIQSSILHMNVIVRRAGADAFDIYVGRSHATTLVEWLADVARDCRERVPHVPESVRSP